MTDPTPGESRLASLDKATDKVNVPFAMTACVMVAVGFAGSIAAPHGRLATLHLVLIVTGSLILWVFIALVTIAYVKRRRANKAQG